METKVIILAAVSGKYKEIERYCKSHGIELTFCSDYSYQFISTHRNLHLMLETFQEIKTYYMGPVKK